MQQTKYCINIIVTSVSGRKDKLMKQMPPNMKHIILANMNVKLTTPFRKVGLVRQLI